MDIIHRIIQIFIFILSFTQCLRATTGRASEDGTEKPLRNYYGIVSDIDGNSFSAEYIAIGSRTTTSKITVFSKPLDPTSDPRRNSTFLNLQNISKLSIDTDSVAIPLRFKNINYVAITVQFKGSTTNKHKYILEAGTRLWCDELNESEPIPKEVQLSAIKEIIITGFRSARIEAKEPTSNKNINSQQEKKRELLCSLANANINQLKKTVKKLPTKAQADATKQVNSLQDEVGSICSTS